MNSLLIITEDPQQSGLSRFLDLATKKSTLTPVVKTLDQVTDDEFHLIVIVDLDTLMVRDTDLIKTFLVSCGKTVYLICESSYQRAAYYKDIGKWYPSWDNLVSDILNTKF